LFQVRCIKQERIKPFPFDLRNSILFGLASYGQGKASLEPRKGTLLFGETLLIDGPASVLVLSGKGSAFGANIAAGDRVLARIGKRIPLTPTSRRLEFEAKTSGKLEIIKCDAIPPSWKKAAESTIGAGGRAIVLGRVDAGKTGFCTYLANRALPKLRNVGYVDGDVGQPEIGPPTTITAAIMERQHYALSKLRATSMHFVGNTSPSYCQDRVIDSVEKCAVSLETKGAKMVIVNTDGWVDEGGLLHKAKLVCRLKPNTVLSFLSKEENAALCSMLEGPTNLLILERPEHARSRNQEERRKSRESAYRAYFRQADRMRIELSRIELVNAPFRTWGAPTACHSTWFRLERGLLAGLMRRESTLGLGMLLGIDRRRGTIDLLCRVESGQEPDRIEFGSIRLDSAFREVAHPF